MPVSHAVNVATCYTTDRDHQPLPEAGDGHRNGMQERTTEPVPRSALQNFSPPPPPPPAPSRRLSRPAPPLTNHALNALAAAFVDEAGHWPLDTHEHPRTPTNTHLSTPTGPVATSGAPGRSTRKGQKYARTHVQEAAKNMVWVDMRLKNATSQVSSRCRPAARPYAPNRT